MCNIQITPIECINNYYFKRDDYFTFGNVNGGKVRSALTLCKNEKLGYVSAGSRKSPQIQIISEIAKTYNLPFIAYVPMGKLTTELIYAKNNGAILEPVPMGFNNNLIKRAKERAIITGYKYIPFGMDCEEVLSDIAEQVVNIPMEINRIIVSVGSGITLSGIIRGLIKYNIDKKIVGIVVGANPVKRLTTYCKNWNDYCTLIKSPIDYHKEIRDNMFCDIELDKIYEAKCIPYIKPGDLFWVIGKGIRS